MDGFYCDRQDRKGSEKSERRMKVRRCQVHRNEERTSWKISFPRHVLNVCVCESFCEILDILNWTYDFSVIVIVQQYSSNGTSAPSQLWRSNTINISLLWDFLTLRQARLDELGTSVWMACSAGNLNLWSRENPAGWKLAWSWLSPDSQLWERHQKVGEIDSHYNIYTYFFPLYT